MWKQGLLALNNGTTMKGNLTRPTGVNDPGVHAFGAGISGVYAQVCVRLGMGGLTSNPLGAERF